MKQMYKNFSLICLLATLTDPAFAAMAINKKKLNQLWEKTMITPRIGFKGDYVDNQQVEARVMGLMIGADVTIPYSDTFKIEFSGGALLETGSNSSFITNEYEPNRIWILKYAQATYNPFEALKLEAGAISQSDYNSPLLVSGSAFLGVRETLSLNFTKNHRVYLKLEQTIPNNINLIQRIGVVEDNGTPYYYNEGIGLELEGDLLGLQVEASQFRFESLAAGIANISRNFGNSVTSGNNISSDFVYGYKGYNLMWDITASPIDSVELEFYGQWLYNDEAPDGRNQGHIYGLGLNMNPWIINIEQFRSESDSSIAYYNSKDYSHNNHEGMLYRFKYEVEDYQEISFTYISSTLLESNSLQSDTEKFILDFNQEF